MNPHGVLLFHSCIIQIADISARMTSCIFCISSGLFHPYCGGKYKKKSVITHHHLSSPSCLTIVMVCMLHFPWPRAPTLFQFFCQWTIFCQLKYDIASPDQLAIYVQLRISWPVWSFLQTLSHIFVHQNIKRPKIRTNSSYAISCSKYRKVLYWILLLSNKAKACRDLLHRGLWKTITGFMLVFFQWTK